MQKISGLFASFFIPALAAFTHAQARPASWEKAAPLAFGETFTINSNVLSETRRVNIYVPVFKPAADK